MLQAFPSSLLVWALYSIAVGATFALIKLVNYRLHHMFDTTEMIKEEASDSSDSKSEKNDNASQCETCDNKAQNNE